MATKRSSIDWTRIEIEYLAGEDSIREIADRHEISDTSIRKRAKAGGWERLPKKVRTPANCEPTPRPGPVQPQQATDPAQIADHGRGLVARMLGELDAVTTYQGEIEDAIELECEDDENGGRRTAMLAAISLAGRAKTLKELATAFKTINEASMPQGKKAAAADRAKEAAGSSRFQPVGKPSLSVVKQ